MKCKYSIILKTTLLFSIFLFASITTSLHAQKLADSLTSFIKSSEVRHLETLSKIFADRSVADKARVLAAEKIIELYSAKHAEADKYAEKVLANTEIAAADSKTVMRTYSCHLLDKFANSAKSDKAFAIVKTLLPKEVDAETASTYAKALGKYQKQAVEASDILLTRLDLFLQQQYQQKNEIKYLKSVIESLGFLKQKKAYLPLMKILQSQYADDVKKTAETAMEKIPWS